jgi:hypothetical protein
MEDFFKKHEKNIAGVISCYDRVLLRGTLTSCCYAQGMTNLLYFKNIKVFDYQNYAQSLREILRKNAENVAKENDITIEHISKSSIRKEEVIKKVLEKRGNHSGLVHILSAMETCTAYKPRYDQVKKHAHLVTTQGKCLHYYFYFIDKDFGLCHVRVPTWCPFTLQFYCNGHNYLANKLKRRKIGFKMADNAFLLIDDFGKAQKLSDQFEVKRLHKMLDKWSRYFCSVIDELQSKIHWSVSQIEYATDIIFKDQKTLEPIYNNLLQTAICAIKSHDISRFLGKKLHGNYQSEIGSNLSTRVEGKRIKHVMKRASIKMYDKFGSILRIETTSNDISFLKHFREVEKKDGGTEKKYAPMKKSIYSINPLTELLIAANRRYIDYLASIDDTSNGAKKLKRLSEKIRKNNRAYRGFNLFDENDKELFRIIIRGEHCIKGMSNKDIREKWLGKTTAQISRLLKNLCLHGIIKKATNCYRYYVTKFGKQIISAGLKIQELMLIPELAKQTI